MSIAERDYRVLTAGLALCAGLAVAYAFSSRADSAVVDGSSATPSSSPSSPSSPTRCPSRSRTASPWRPAICPSCWRSCSRGVCPPSASRSPSGCGAPGARTRAPSSSTTRRTSSSRSFLASLAFDALLRPARRQPATRSPSACSSPAPSPRSSSRRPTSHCSASACASSTAAPFARLLARGDAAVPALAGRPAAARAGDRGALRRRRHHRRRAALRPAVRQPVHVQAPGAREASTWRGRRSSATSTSR